VRSLKSRGSTLTFKQASEILKSAHLELCEESDIKGVNSVGKSFQCFCCLSSEHGVRKCPFTRGDKPFCLYCLVSGHWSAKCEKKKCEVPSFKEMHCVLCEANIEFSDVEEDPHQDPEVKYMY